MTAIVSRAEWGARPPALIEKFSGVIPFVVIHHSYIPPACTTTEDCKSAMRKMQDMHQLTNKWNDIGYTFAIGGDGQVYEGRGYNTIAAHAPRYNDKSIGICMIGDWRSIYHIFNVKNKICLKIFLAELPPDNMMQALKNLIQRSMDKGVLSKTHKVLGHRQVRDTECPGDRLFQEISTWEHFSAKPAGPEDKNFYY